MGSVVVGLYSSQFGAGHLEIETMVSSFAKLIVVTAVASSGSVLSAQGEDLAQTAELWLCSGYCFMGGDTATNPWVPVSANGASEQEARDNIDCGPFVEVGISCRSTRYNVSEFLAK
jgi:hypothetical protein